MESLTPYKPTLIEKEQIGQLKFPKVEVWGRAAEIAERNHKIIPYLRLSQYGKAQGLNYVCRC